MTLLVRLLWERRRLIPWQRRPRDDSSKHLTAQWIWHCYPRRSQTRCFLLRNVGDWRNRPSDRSRDFRSIFSTSYLYVYTGNILLASIMLMTQVTNVFWLGFRTRMIMAKMYLQRNILTKSGRLDCLSFDKIAWLWWSLLIQIESTKKISGNWPDSKNIAGW